MKKHARIDRIDRNILKRLQCDGRVSNVKLAKSVGISPPPCLRRVRALEDAGYINSYHAKLNHSSMGYGVTIFAMVKLESQSEGDIRAFNKHIETISMVREAYIIAGDYDYILKIVAKDWDAYQELFTNKLTNAPNVISIKSSLTIKMPKSKNGVPID